MPKKDPKKEKKEKEKKEKEQKDKERKEKKDKVCVHNVACCSMPYVEIQIVSCNVMQEFDMSR